MWKASRRYRSSGQSVNRPVAAWISMAARAESSADSTLTTLAFISSASQESPWSNMLTA